MTTGRRSQSDSNVALTDVFQVRPPIKELRSISDFGPSQNESVEAAVALASSCRKDSTASGSLHALAVLLREKR